jgi:hypothetical protein
MVGIRDWLAQAIGRLPIDCRTGVLAEARDVTALDPDVVIVATGGLPDTELASDELGGIPGGELAVSAWDILSGNAAPGEQVLVYDISGRHEGASAVNLLCDRGSAVAFVTPDRQAFSEIGGQNFPIYLRRFHRQGVTIIADSRVAAIRRTGNRLTVSIANIYGGADREREVDQVVIENGTVPNDDLYHALKPGSSNLGEIDIERLVAGRPQEIVRNPDGRYRLFRIGDAASSRNLHAAMLDARRIARAL